MKENKKLKIDQQFIGRLQEGGADSRIVSAILGIADALDLEVVAEGIERHDEINILGVKGIGELSNVGTAAAITDAVWHATGKRVRDLPVTIDKII